MKLNNIKIYWQLIAPIVVIILFFRLSSRSIYLNSTLFPDIAKNAPEMNKYPSLLYEKQLESTMLVKITGALAQKRKGA
jgi:hypothetical protein